MVTSLTSTVLLLSLAAASARAEVTVVEKKYSEDKIQCLFYEDGQRVAYAVKVSSGEDSLGALRVVEGKVPDGPIKEYYPSGKLKSVQRFVDDGRSAQLCVLEAYHRNGRLAVRLEREGCLLQGKGYYYNADGTPEMLEEHRNGRLHGWTVHYYKNGKPKKSIYYANGKKHGPTKTYYKDGKTESEGRYANDEFDGLGRMFAKDGKLSYEVNYRAGKKDGQEKVYYPDGKTVRTFSIYKDGELVSKTEYDEQGRPKH